MSWINVNEVPLIIIKNMKQKNSGSDQGLKLQARSKYNFKELSQIGLTLFGSSFGSGTMQYPSKFSSLGLLTFSFFLIFSIAVNYNIHCFLIEIADKHGFTSFSQVADLMPIKKFNVFLSMMFVISFFFRLLSSLSSINFFLPNIIKGNFAVYNKFINENSLMFMVGFILLLSPVFIQKKLKKISWLVYLNVFTCIFIFAWFHQEISKGVLAKFPLIEYSTKASLHFSYMMSSFPLQGNIMGLYNELTPPSKKIIKKVILVYMGCMGLLLYSLSILATLIFGDNPKLKEEIFIRLNGNSSLGIVVKFLFLFICLNSFIFAFKPFKDNFRTFISLMSPTFNTHSRETIFEPQNLSVTILLLSLLLSIAGYTTIKNIKFEVFSQLNSEIVFSFVFLMTPLYLMFKSSKNSVFSDKTDIKFKFTS